MRQKNTDKSLSSGTDARGRRIAYIAFHKAGRDVELPVLRELGFEVYTIKKFSEHHRSGAFDYSDDNYLSIPRDVINYLNGINFIDVQDWPPMAVYYLNKYFKYIFVIQNHHTVYSALRRFRGKVVVRLAGLDIPKSYTNYWSRNEPRLLPLAKARGKDVWMSVQYENLTAVEDEFLRSRAVFMPLGMPSFAKESADTWRGDHRTIAAVIPWIHMPYYQTKYQSALRHVQERPFSILGDQREEINDRRVAGYLDKAEFVRRLQGARALFYESYEPRHVHFPPFEAAMIGLPVLFTRGCLLHELAGGDVAGSFGDMEEFRKKVDWLLAGDEGFVREVQEGQRAFLTWFADDFVARTWREAFGRMEEVAKGREKPLGLHSGITVPGVLITQNDSGGFSFQGRVQDGRRLGDARFLLRARVIAGRDALPGDLKVAVSGMGAKALSVHASPLEEFTMMEVVGLFEGVVVGRGEVDVAVSIEGAGIPLETIVDVALAREVIGLDEVKSFRGANGEVGDFILTGFRTDGGLGIDSFGSKSEIIFASTEDLANAEGVRMLMSCDYHQDSSDYYLEIHLNGKPIVSAPCNKFRGDLTFDVKEHLGILNRISIFVTSSRPTDGVDENSLFLHLSRLGFLGAENR
ncbi:hypothetical protein [Caulobacter sp. CCUG 60055]|uniref:hypothetical protein n=1 Tax=Caulobacter sp. CCUG 60055 TaxID=2100090 RepID=UPI001FA7E978|nr:hypothetical protein [Caulobacter sp. CCUG 60055]